MENDDQEKTEEPSQYRIEEFRTKGIVATSKEVVSVAVLCATLMSLIMSSLFIWEKLTTYFRWITSLYPEMAFTDRMIKIIINQSMLTLFICTIPVLATAFLVGIAAHIMQIGFIFSAEPLTLKFDRLNPVVGMKRIFSSKSIFEVFKGLLKFAIIISISYVIFKGDLAKFPGFLQLDFAESFLFGKVMLIKLSFSILLGLSLVAVCDYFWERFLFRKKLLQSKQEQKQESKEKEGNPEIRHKIRVIQREMARKRMMADVPKADVIVTNPTHFSVALRYDKENMVAPMVVAKGIDHLALRIREVARQHEIPIIENRPLARTLYKTVKIGEAVPRSLYKAIAEIIAYVIKLKKKTSRPARIERPRLAERKF